MFVLLLAEPPTPHLVFAARLLDAFFIWYTLVGHGTIATFEKAITSTTATEEVSDKLPWTSQTCLLTSFYLVGMYTSFRQAPIVP